MINFNFEVETKVDPESWDAAVLKLNGICFHQYAWSLYSSIKYNATPYYFKLTRDGKQLAMCFGLLHIVKRAGINLYKWMSFSSLPASRDHEAAKQILQQIISYCRDAGITMLDIGSFGTPVDFNILEQLGFAINKRWEFLVDIDMPEDKLWMSFNTKKRNKIKKGRKYGWKIIRADSMEHVLEFRNLALETQRRKNEQGIPFPVAEEKEYRMLKDMVMDAGLGRLYLAFNKENRPVAAAFLAGTKESASAYYMLSSSNYEGLRGAAPDLLLWKAMTDFQKDGYRLFNLGGVSEGELNGLPLEKSGLYTFKKTFSPKIYSCGKGTLVLRPIQNMIYKGLTRFKGILD